MAIPDRWIKYDPVGKCIPGTRFIAFKVPLRKEISARVEKLKQLTPRDLLDKIPNLGLIIDLTNTRRYYDPQFFLDRGIEHIQINVPGHHVPPSDLTKKFNMAVFSFLNKNTNNDKLIGVHCTHGVNRTGFMICQFMISELRIEPEKAIESVRLARGYAIERKNYLDALYNIGGAQPPIETEAKPENWRLRAVSPHDRRNDLSPKFHHYSSEENSRIYRRHGGEEVPRVRKPYDREECPRVFRRNGFEEVPRVRKPYDREECPRMRDRNDSQQTYLSRRSNRNSYADNRNDRHFVRDDSRSRLRTYADDGRRSGSARVIRRGEASSSDRQKDRDNCHRSDRSRQHESRNETNKYPSSNSRSIQLVRQWPRDPYK